MKWKSIGLKALTVGMTAIMAMQTPVMSLQASAAATQYISEVILSYGNTDAEAKDWLTQNGYKIVGQNLNEGGEGGSDAFSWLGLASTKRSVFLGYKTTTNPEDAITDMKIMNMNGGYSYEAYEKVLEDTKAEKEHFLQNIMAALREYRENYKKGAVKAKIAHDNLNKFKDDDSGALMGDLLLNTLKTEDEAAWEADPTQHADMVTILMQGNSTCVSEIMQNLAFAADTSDTSFVNRAIAAAKTPVIAQEASPDDEPESTVQPQASAAKKSPFDTFFDSYMEQHPTYTKDDAVTELIRIYDDDAKMFASSLIGLRNYLSNYTQSELSMNATTEETDAYFAEHEFEDPTAWAGAASAFSMLSGIFYGDASLLSYLVYNDDDFASDSALLSGYEALGLPQRAKLYPFIEQMSAGQRSLLEYTAMDRLLTMGLMDAETWQATYATMQDEEFGAKDLETCSVYAEVNRDDFKVGEIAVTNMAQGKQASTGEPMDEGLFGVGISYATAGLFVGGIAVSVAGIAIAARNWSADAVVNNFANSPAFLEACKKNMQGNDSLYHGLKSMFGGRNVPGITSLEITSPEQLTNFIRDERSAFRAFGYAVKGMKQDQVKSKVMDFMILNRGKKLTISGPDRMVGYDAGYNVKLDEKGNFVSMTSNDGTVILADGSIKVDMDIRNQFDETMTLINPDFKDGVVSADDFLNKAASEAGKSVDDVITGAQTTFDDFFNDANFMEEYKNYYFERGYSLSDIPDITDIPDDELATILQNADNEFNPNPNYDVASVLKKKQIIKAEQYREDNWVVVDNMDDIAAGGKEAADKADDAAEAAMTSGSGSTFWKWFGAGMALVGLIMSAYSVYAAISEMKEYYHQEMLPIPRKMVDLGYYDDGTTCYIYYDCAKCNRTAMNMGNETLGDYGDLNGDVMKQWLALYTTKDTRAGKPILASIVVKKGTTSIPMKTVPLSFFGFKSAVNMTDTRFTYNNAKNGIYLYYKQEAASYTGTVATGNLYVTVGVLSALGGAGVCGILIALLGKRKKKDEQPTETKAA